MGQPAKFHPPHLQDNESYLHLSISRANPYLPIPSSLKHGKLKGRTEVLLRDGKTRIFVAKGHDINRAVTRYEDSLKFKLKGR